jgi:serine/threonine protein kinase
MGEVYRATDTKLKRQVAIKILPASLAADADRLARFQREAEVLASLNHPHIASIYGIEEVEGQRALVMELVEGEDLSEIIARHGHPALAAAAQIGGAAPATREAERVGGSGRPSDGEAQSGRGGGAPRHVREVGIPLPDALAIARQIATALEAAHEAGIVHRDLKPANVKSAMTSR